MTNVFQLNVKQCYVPSTSAANDMLIALIQPLMDDSKTKVVNEDE